ncbi:hypothetical protein [Cyanothece sp. BG0011]|uniref:hypothetical protein n=1 Tax=Cyanothece sp. BG0011 TaxID=2082950 RepID=UPI000D1DE294|nr:hypothetical protein [Cyanothece sp. BG0011]
MRKALIIVNAEVKAEGTTYLASPATEKMVTALETAIYADSPSTQVEVIPAASLWSRKSQVSQADADILYCPLTIEMPSWLSFPEQKIYQDCKDIKGRRQWVEKTLGYKTSIGDSWLGDLWLPIAVTPTEFIYGEIIGEGAFPNSYEQPIALNKSLYRPLYELAEGLLESLDAPSSLYLLQFRLKGQQIVFDRLWPFPAAPAIASLTYPHPNLFTCYWHCLTHQPLPSLTGSPS